MRSQSPVFSPGRIGKLEVKNRLVRSGTMENAASDAGTVTEALLDIYRTLASGGVGLIVTGVMPVCGNVASPRQVRIDDDAFLPGLRRIPHAVRSAVSDCKIVAQLWHPGRQIPDHEDPARFLSYLPPALLKVLRATAQPTPLGSATHGSATHGSATPGEAAHAHPEPTAPSAIVDQTFGKTPRALSREEIEELIEAFADAMGRVEEAGFDGVQLHAAHGWLPSAFLSPHTNRRTDEFGGSTERRTRFVRDIYARARRRVSPTFPILIKLNTTDFLPSGTDGEEAAAVGAMLSAAGFSALEASGGMWEAMTRSEEDLGWPPVLLPEARTNIRTREQEAYFLPGARALKRQSSAPIILVGGLRSISRIEEVLREGAADFVALSRPLIRQPDLPNRWRAGSGPETAECRSCNACIPMGPEPLRCNSRRVA